MHEMVRVRMRWNDQGWGRGGYMHNDDDDDIVTASDDSMLECTLRRGTMVLWWPGYSICEAVPPSSDL